MILLFFYFNYTRTCIDIYLLILGHCVQVKRRKKKCVCTSNSSYIYFLFVVIPTNSYIALQGYNEFISLWLLLLFFFSSFGGLSNNIYFGRVGIVHGSSLQDFFLLPPSFIFLLLFQLSETFFGGFCFVVPFLSDGLSRRICRIIFARTFLFLFTGCTLFSEEPTECRSSCCMSSENAIKKIFCLGIFF